MWPIVYMTSVTQHNAQGSPCCGMYHYFTLFVLHFSWASLGSYGNPMFSCKYFDEDFAPTFIRDIGL